MGFYDALVAKWPSLSGTTAQKLAAINALTVTGPAIPLIVPTYKIYNLIVASEYQALTAAKQGYVNTILAMGTVDGSAGTQVSSVLLACFPSGTATYTALVALAASYDAPSYPWWSAPWSMGGGGLSNPVNAQDLIAAGGLT